MRKPNAERLAWVQSASKIILGIFILFAATSIFKKLHDSRLQEIRRRADIQDQEAKRQADLQQDILRRNADAQVTNAQANLLREERLKRERQQSELAEREAEKRAVEEAAAEREQRAVMARAAEDELQVSVELNGSGGNRDYVAKSVRRTICGYFESASSTRPTDGPTRLNFCARQVNFYGSMCDIARLKEIFAQQEARFPIRNFLLLHAHAIEVDSDVFNIRAEVKTELVDQNGKTSTSQDACFMQIARDNGNLRFTVVGDKVFAGWMVASYRARITPDDLRQSGPRGKDFADLRWTSQEELCREIILQDRFNHEAHITNDPDDQSDDYFSAREKLRSLITKRRQEMTGMKMVLVGSLKQLVSGNAHIQVKIFKDTKVVLEVGD